ncbi:hypothetical protein L7F22_033323 [Adiantum nelumboides]|nr:hypothetical protein [Adiantum nelumboides]
MDSSIMHIENKMLKRMEALEQSVKILEIENAKLKEEITSLKEVMAVSKELREEGEIQETDKVAIKEEITKELTKAMEVKMEATKEGWVDVVCNKIKKEVKEEKQHEETLWMHATLEEKKMREARMLNVRVSGLKEEHGTSSESDGRALCAKLGMVWFEAATVVPMAPPVTVPAESVLKSALAGGLACALSTCLMHPLDTIKTRVQASSTLSFSQLISRLPDIGVRGLYRGSIPAILGQFSSHGLRTGIFEASKLLLTNLAPGVPELQVQSLASFCSTFLGTAVRIPCEVLKQRLQANIFDNVGDAIVGTWRQDGPRGFFRGTGATLCREVPFYVAGMGIYAEAKKVMRRILNRELEPWETIAVGAISGGLAAVFTTPFDVMKTRTMTAAPGLSTKMSTIALTIVREEGLLGLFKGAVPRFFWIAPLGAMNFAGYELAKRAMDKPEQD